MADEQFTNDDKPGEGPKDADRKVIQTVRGRIQRGIEVSGTLRGSGEFVTLNATEVPLTFDMKDPAITEGQAQDGKKVILILRVLDAADGVRLPFRVSSHLAGTDDADAHWTVLGDEDYEWNPVDIQTLHIRTVGAGPGFLYYELLYI